MKVTIDKGAIGGKITAPPSKSYTIRGLMCAALACGESEIVHPLCADDTDAAARVLGGIGVGVEQAERRAPALAVAHPKRNPRRVSGFSFIVCLLSLRRYLSLSNVSLNLKSRM